MKRTLRNASTLSESLQRHLNTYALAASAAGVGMLTLAHAAEAKIVYTSAHKQLPLNHLSPLDLNHDGTADFFFNDSLWGTTYSAYAFLSISPTGPNKRNNQIWGTGRGKNRVASALPAGVSVGPKGRFYPGQGQMAWGNGSFSGPGCSNSKGPWADATGRYLGLKFSVGKEDHFGWARLNVQCSEHGEGFSATLTGYAYETVPDKPIITGKTKGPDVIPMEPGSLGALAAGSSRLHKAGK